MPRANLISLFAEFQRYAGDVAVVQRRGYRRGSWTYAQLARAAVSCARELHRRGVRTGERVVLWGPNSAEWLAAFWGCLLRGAVAVPLDDGATPEFVVRVARETSAKLVVAARSKVLETADAAHQAVIPRLDLEDFPDDIAESLTDIDARHRDNIAPPAEAQGATSFEQLADEPITRKHIAQILFTSGTTAQPHGVVLTHGNFLANLEPLERGIDPYRKYEKWLHPLRFVTLVPLSHVFGQFMALFVPPLLGAAIVFEPAVNPREIARTVKRERATALIAVPRMLDGLRNGLLREFAAEGKGQWFAREFAAAEGEKFLRRAWRFRRVHRRFGWKFWAFISGGAALGGETELFFKRLGYAVVQGYGMTETASLISLNHPFRAAQGSIGKVLPGREFKLADDGEILVRGENVASGYWEAGQLRAAAASGGVAARDGGAASEAGACAATGDGSEAGWLRTGDVAEMDAEGNLRFRGRKKNVIVTPAGLNVYPEDLEAALRKQASVRDCVVVPVERGGNAEPCAVLLLEAISRHAGVSADAGYVSAAADAGKVEASSPTAPVLLGTNPADGPGAESPARRVVEAANESLAEYQRMRIWVTWPEADFPRTATGKPRLAAIAEGAQRILAGAQLDGERSDARSIGRASGLEDLILRFAAQASGSGSVSGDAADLLEGQLDLSSLDRVELMSALEERYQVELSEMAFAEAKTVGDVERLLREPAGRRSEYVYPRWTQREPMRWVRLAVYYALVWPATQILAHPRIVGHENLRGVRGPLLVVSNHVTRRADIGLILAGLPMRLRHRLAAAIGGETLQEMRRPPRAWFFAKRWVYQLNYWLVIALFNVFPLPRFSGFRESFRFAGETVDRGYNVLVFPEGQSNDTETGEMAKFFSGIGLLADNLGLPVVPMRMDGVWQMKRERRRLARLGEISIYIGKPVRFPAGTAPEAIARALEKLVREA
jgi:long-chain acyl-CoA synthetase